jgi:Ca2+-binding RTX toxin-like protein
LIGARRISALALAAAMLAMLAPSAGGSASAARPESVGGPASTGVSCRFDPSTHLLSVTAIEGDEAFPEPDIRRVGNAIRVSEPGPHPAISCDGAPTVTNTDRVEILLRGGIFTSADIELRGGPFAPGATAEADGASEIEFSVRGSGTATIEGGPWADRFQYLSAGGVSGINVNPAPGDRDVDVALPEVKKGSGLDLRRGSLFPIVNGGPGPDRFEVVGRPPVYVAVNGAGGNDTMLAGDAVEGALLDGRAGRDRILGSPRRDIVDPGPGADTVEGFGGPDWIQQTSDHSHDTIDCGSGRDKTGRHDPFDRLRSC